MIKIDLNNEKIDFPGQQPIMIKDLNTDTGDKKVSEKEKKVKTKYYVERNQINILQNDDLD